MCHVSFHKSRGHRQNMFRTDEDRCFSSNPWRSLRQNRLARPCLLPDEHALSLILELSWGREEDANRLRSAARNDDDSGVDCATFANENEVASGAPALWRQRQR